MLQDLDGPTIDPAIQSQEDKEIYHQNISNDLDDVEEIPLYSRRNNAIVTQRNGKQAYMKQCYGTCNHLLVELELEIEIS